MKKIYLLYIILLSHCLLGCSEQNNNVEEITLSGYNPTELNSAPYTRFPHRVEIQNDILMLLDLASDSMFYHFFDYPDLKYLYSAGKRGQGDKEIILPTPFQIHDNKAYLLDGARAKLYIYDYSHKDSIRYVDSWNINENKTTLDFVLLNDSNVIFQDFGGENRLIHASFAVRKGLFTLPGNENQQANADLAYIWRSYMAYNRNLEKLALATQFGDVIEIYDLRNGTSRLIEGAGGNPRNDKGRIEGYMDIKWNGNYIYALYSGRLQRDLIRKSEAGQKEPTGGNIIKVYNEVGDMISQYKLDKYINGFAIDSLNKRIIGVTSNLDNPILFFDLSDVCGVNK